MSKRYMGDDISLIYDLIHYINYNNLLGLLICIDFEKALDSVDWNCMVTFGFGTIIWPQIYTFHTKIKSTVIVNGHTSPWLSAERGCRQGDPISLMCGNYRYYEPRKQTN